MTDRDAHREATIETVDLVKEYEKLLRKNKELREALEMVRDADNDCHLDGLPTIPQSARAKIDRALRED